MATTLGGLIRETREARNITQKDLAIRLGITPPYLKDIEAGNRTPNNERFLSNLAVALQLNSDVVFFAAGLLPPDITQRNVSHETISAAFAVFRGVLDESRTVSPGP